jgi:hypothetical protein
VPLLHVEIFILDVFQNFVFGQIWQFWVEFATLTMAKSMPKARLKSQKPSNSSIMNPNTT